MANELPEVRQCADPDSPFFGAVAVKSTLPGIAWSIMTLANGGHHDADGKEVDSWETLPAPSLKPVSPPTPPPAPPTPPPAPPTPPAASVPAPAPAAPAPVKA